MYERIRRWHVWVKVISGHEKQARPTVTGRRLTGGSHTATSMRRREATLLARENMAAYVVARKQAVAREPEGIQ